MATSSETQVCEDNNNNGKVTESEDVVIQRRKICDLNVSRIYLSHTLTSWGDRMWGFAVALYLVILFPESLQYTAIYGFTTCICVIIGGPCIGKWVDRSMRLKAATYAIATQNLAVSCCAVLLIIMMSSQNQGDVVSAWGGSNHILFLCAIILFAVIGELASVGSKIALERDWIVVLAENNEARLSKMNAVMRTIDLTTSILAPAVVAQIISFVSKIAGASFIAIWNLISGGIEIYLLHKIFMSFPDLAQKELEVTKSHKSSGNGKNENMKIPTIFVENSPNSPDYNSVDFNNDNRSHNMKNFASPVTALNRAEADDKQFMLSTPEPYRTSVTEADADGHDQLHLIHPDFVHESGNGENQFIPTPRGMFGLPAKDFDEVALTPLQYQNEIENDRQNGNGSSKSVWKNTNNDLNFDKRLRNQSDSQSPIGLGIDQLTVSSERLFGTPGNLNIRGTECLQQILESLSGWRDYFQHPLRFAGLGLALLYMTVLGFDSITIGYMYSQGISESVIGILTAIGAVSGILGSLSFPFLRKKMGKCAVGNFGFGFETLCLIMCVVSVFVDGSPFKPCALWSLPSDANILSIANVTSNLHAIESSTEVSKNRHLTYSSVIMFSIGILVSRYGLWIADLSVTQFFQEEVPENQRGILNGVQDSLNQVMNLIKFLLVILFPKPPTFGYLILLSWIFVFFGWVSFMIFTCSWRRRRNKIKCNTLSPRVQLLSS